MVTPPARRLQSPRSDLSGYARRRATTTRPRPDGHFRHEDHLISTYKSFGSYFGNYWTGEEVVETDLHPFAPSALLQDGLGLCCGDQVAVMSCDGYWQAAFVGIVGDPYRTWEQRLPQPRAGESFVDCPRVPATRKLSCSACQYSAGIPRSPVEGITVIPVIAAVPYESRSQREPSRNRWSASRMPSDDSSHRSCRQESPRFAFSGGTFRGCPVGPNYKPASKSQKPMVELKSAVKSTPDVELKSTVESKPVVKSKPAVKSKRAVVSKPAVKSKSVVNPKSADGPVSSLMKFVQSLADPVPKPAVKSPSTVKSKPAVTPKPTVELPCDPPALRLADPPTELHSPVRSQSDVASEFLVAPPPVVELPPRLPRPASAPNRHDAIGFAEGWTSRTSRASPRAFAYFG
ncbi:hypothetical protein THAOC_36250 [Thalassiosira oceanica]|uniref:Uncharacterized protein n=1 Tax=Thalassiosira oceanica TaxID=159749 RepID=K0R0I1_THAOC|nr:hypothetical protein THAOC_36250 [Thalassiosira oceanica]|eukprot:EJK45150.1 hypothetical protein THAOC_36250 [Thalassiosira oceanica]